MPLLLRARGVLAYIEGFTLAFEEWYAHAIFFLRNLHALFSYKVYRDLFFDEIGSATTQSAEVVQSVYKFS
jgi:hypothetical protein